MNPKMSPDRYNNLVGAFEINRNARRQEIHQAYLEAEWNNTHQKPAAHKPSWLKAAFAWLQAALPALIRPFAPARRQPDPSR